MHNEEYNYTFNKEYQRLEPGETKCQYCDTEHSTDMEDNYFVPLFHEETRTNIIVYSSVKFKQIPVGIPRCKKCKSIHQNSADLGALIGWSITLGLVILSFKIFGWYALVSLLIAPFVGVLLKLYFERRLIRAKGIYTKKDGAQHNEAVQDMVFSGWTFTQPMA